MIRDSSINPFLAKSLGLNDFESLARYYVFQHVGRSVVTSFGSNMEQMIKVLFTGERGVWWDVVRKTKKIHYYVSVKSGANDMDKDQAVHFASEAKKIMEEEFRQPGAINKPLRNQRLDTWTIFSFQV